MMDTLITSPIRIRDKSTGEIGTYQHTIFVSEIPSEFKNIIFSQQLIDYLYGNIVPPNFERIDPPLIAIEDVQIEMQKILKIKIKS